MSYVWQFSTPEAEGMNSEILNGVDEYLKQKRYRLINSILVIKNEKIIFEHYYNKFNCSSKNNIKSIWKSILSIVTGICLDRGIIKSLDEPISNYLQEFAEDNHIYHKGITIRHLLTMCSGIHWNNGIHYSAPMMDQMKRTDSWISYISDIAMSQYPGHKFQYKEWDVILLSAVLGKASGRTAYDLCNNFLYKPLGIESGIWPCSPDKVSYSVMKGEEKSDLSARDLAKLGILFLNKGTFHNERIVSEEYIKQAINPNKVSIEYGYLWWIFNGGYGCRGFGGQEVSVYPDNKLITVIQATPTPLGKAYEDLSNYILKASR